MHVTNYLIVPVYIFPGYFVCIVSVKKRKLTVQVELHFHCTYASSNQILCAKLKRMIQTSKLQRIQL